VTKDDNDEVHFVWGFLCWSGGKGLPFLWRREMLQLRRPFPWSCGAHLFVLRRWSLHPMWQLIPWSRRPFMPKLRLSLFVKTAASSEWRVATGEKGSE